MNLFYSFGFYLISYVIEFMFQGNFYDFLNLSIFYIILINILLILSEYRSTFPPYRLQTNFVAACFSRRFYCFWYYEFSYKIF